MLKPGVAAALYAPTTGTVNPWQLEIAAFENAVKNGVEVLRNTEVLGIRKNAEGFLLETNEDAYQCKMVFNCAGLSAVKVQELAFPPSVRLKLDGAEYLVLDKLAEKPSRVIFHQAESCGKGITAIPCTEGNLLISGIRKPLDVPFGTTAEGLQALHIAAKELLPDADSSKVIRSFGAVRPNPHRENGESISDFCIENPAPGFYGLIGIKTPGLTCANELGLIMAKQLAEVGLAVTMVEKRNQCGGMARNQRCLEEHSIQLICGDTIREVQGYPHVTGCVTAKGVYLPCKTLLIAAGLIPERELVAHLADPDWLHICGNCRTVHPMVEAVVNEGKQAGIAALKHMR